MKKKQSLFLFATILLCSGAMPAQAQFFKKLFHKKEEPVRKPIHRNPPATQQAQATTATSKKSALKEKQEPQYAATRKRFHYRVDVLAPLYLDQLVKDDQAAKGKIPDKAIQGIEFYEGLKIAADTLNNLQYIIDVYVHDITDITETPESLVNGNRLDSSDLIIGAVQGKDITVVAKFAKKKHINFISALSPADGGVKDNQYLTLLQPSLQDHCERIIQTVKDKYKNNTVTLLYRTSVPSEDNAYSYLIKENNDAIKFKELLCNTAPGYDKLKQQFDSTKANKIVMAILDNNYAEALLKQLYEQFPTYSFEVYGMPSWKSMASLHKADAYPNVAVYITVPFYFDASTPLGQHIENAYKSQFDGRPGELVYRGYETMYWYANLLRDYGTIFNEYMGRSSTAPFTRFDIEPKYDKNNDLLYNENRYLYLYRYQSGSYLVERQ